MLVKGLFWQNLGTNLYRPVVRTRITGPLGYYPKFSVGDTLYNNGNGYTSGESVYLNVGTIQVYSTYNWGDFFVPSFIQNNDEILLTLSEFDSFNIPATISYYQPNPTDSTLLIPLTNKPCTNVETNYNIGDRYSSNPIVTNITEMDISLIAIDSNNNNGLNPIDKNFYYDNSGDIIAPRIKQDYISNCNGQEYIMSINFAISGGIITDITYTKAMFNSELHLSTW